MFTAEVFTAARTRKKPESSLRNKWIKKMWYTYVMVYYPPIKMKQNCVICRYVDAPRPETEGSQEIEKQILVINGYKWPW